MAGQPVHREVGCMSKLTNAADALAKSLQAFGAPSVRSLSRRKSYRMRCST
jgi:hypothetical protein